MMLLALGCAGPTEPLPACTTPITEGWAPEMEEETRLDDASAHWLPTDAGTVETHFAYDRGETYHIVMETGGVDPVTVREHATTGSVETLAEGMGPLVDLEVTPARVGEYVSIEIPADATVISLAVTDSTWASVDVGQKAPLLLGFLIHVESDPQFTAEADRWTRRARVLEGLSAMMAKHGAVLTLQVDVSFIRGAALWDDGWVDARAEEGASWSVHAHKDGEDLEALESAVRDARRGFAEAGVRVADVNAGFSLAPWSTFESAGYASLSAYKDEETQADLPLAHVQPWRPPDGVGSSDADAFQVHDANGPLVFLPGASRRETDHSRFGDYASRVLSQVRSHTREDLVNVWYFVLHVDGFGPGGGRPETDDYLDGVEFAEDLAYYDAFFGDVLDPLVASGDLAYSSPDGMREAFLRWEGECTQ